MTHESMFLVVFFFAAVAAGALAAGIVVARGERYGSWFSEIDRVAFPIVSGLMWPLTLVVAIGYVVWRVAAAISRRARGAGIPIAKVVRR